MNIEFKFSVGQAVYSYWLEKVRRGVVVSATVRPGESVEYGIAWGDDPCTETYKAEKTDCLFATPEEAITRRIEAYELEIKKLQLELTQAERREAK